MLVDYGDSDDEEAKDIPIVEKIDKKPDSQTTKKKTLNISDLKRISKKIKGNDEKEIVRPLSESSEDEAPVIEKRGNKNQMLLPQPKNKLENQVFEQSKRRRLPPPPPGMNFSEAEKLASSLLTNDDRKLISEFDQDDEFLLDPQAISRRGQQSVTWETAEVDGDDVQVMRINDKDDKYWQLQRDKLMQQQQVYMKVPEDVSSQKKEKNHIDSLYYQAALKEQYYDERKQNQQTNQQKMKSRYGW